MKEINSIGVPRPIAKNQFEAAVWRHYLVDVWPTRHSLFYKGQFWIRWVLMADKLLKSHQIEIKYLYLYPENFSKILAWSCCLILFSCRCSVNPSFLVTQSSIYNYLSTPDRQTSQITLNWKWKPPFTFQGILQKCS